MRQHYLLGKYYRKKYIEEINRLREENFRLIEKNQDLVFEMKFKKSEGAESLIMPSLFDEFQKISTSLQDESISSPRIADFNSTAKAFASQRDFSTQTITAIKKIDKKNEKNRGCCSWF